MLSGANSVDDIFDSSINGVVLGGTNLGVEFLNKRHAVGVAWER